MIAQRGFGYRGHVHDIEAVEHGEIAERDPQFLEVIEGQSFSLTARSISEPSRSRPNAREPKTRTRRIFGLAAKTEEIRSTCTSVRPKATYVPDSARSRSTSALSSG